MQENVVKKDPYKEVIPVESSSPYMKEDAGSISEQSKKTRASRVKLMWERFWNMQWMLCPVEKDLQGAQVTTFKEEISKCLNNSSRALFLKLMAFQVRFIGL